MDLTENGKQCLLSLIMIICIANVIRNFGDTKKKMNENKFEFQVCMYL